MFQVTEEANEFENTDPILAGLLFARRAKSVPESENYS